MSIHIVKIGECADSIAATNGLFWETMWFHEKNAQLRGKRSDPFVLMAGDEMFVPELTVEHASCAMGAHHKFRRLGSVSKFRIQVCVMDKPLSDQPFESLVNGIVTTGHSDPEGWIEFPIDPNSKNGELWVGDPEEDEREYILLDLGGMNPVSEVSGMQQRLMNIGFAVGEPGELDDETCAAISEFQMMKGVEQTGEADAATLDLLVETHGS